MSRMVPIETDSTPVEAGTVGEPPHAILWRGRQWAVTEYGIEALDGSYPIEAHRLGEDFAEWSWLMQMGEKNWVDLPDFTTAFMVALVLHGRAPGFDRAQILDDFRRGMRLRDSGTPSPPFEV